MDALRTDSRGLASRVYGEHGPAVRRYFQRLTRNPDLADDLAQEVFLKVVRAAGTYQAQERERAWIFRIAQNVLLDYYRKAGRSREEPDTFEALQPAPQGLAADLQHALARLPADDREVFLLGEVGGLSYAEISSLLDTTVPAVRSRIYRARLALREMLTPPAPLTGAAARRYDDEGG
jgi:RNA polymerase sigma-70 factor, ECF subfamily